YRPPLGGEPRPPIYGRYWDLPHVEGNDQWWDYGRSHPPELSLDSIVHVDGDRFEAASINESAAGPTRWAIFAESRLVRPLNWLPDIP
ncbi:MAG TPA: hypothetical protein VGS21_01730, partial [Acidimicrobiales bacterium]|nr:hypothetical protein [Acidimicrobiales bacterium]